MPVTNETRIEVTASNKTKAAFKKIKKDLTETQRLTKSLSTATRVMTAAYIAFRAIGAITSVWKDFSKSISELSAITGATGKDLEFLTMKSLEFGAATTLSASQAAEAFRLVASAKPDLLESGEALAAVTAEAITLAEASGSTLPDAAKTLTLALNQTGASADQANRFINVLAAGSKYGSSVISDTSEAIAKAGLVAGVAGTGFEEMNAAIQVLAKNTIFGSEAGTDLRNIYLNLSKQTNEKFKPAMVGFTQAMQNLAESGMSPNEMLAIFGKRNITAARAMVGNVELLKKLTGQMTDTNVAGEQAAIQVDNLDGDWKRMGSTWETTALILGDKFDPAMRAIVGVFTRVGQWISTIIVGITGLGDVMASFAAQSASFLSGDFQVAKEIGKLRDEKLLSMEKELDLIWQTKAARKALTAEEKAKGDADALIKLKERLAKEDAIQSAARSAAFEKAYEAEELALNDKYAMALFKLQESLLTEEEALAIAREDQEWAIEDAFQIGLVKDLERKELLLAAEAQFQTKLTALNQTEINKREKAEARFSKQLVAMKMQVAQQAIGLLNMVVGESKAGQLVVLALSKGLALAQLAINTQVAIMRAYADLGPIGGSVAAAGIATMAAISAGIIVATGVVQAAGIAGGGSSVNVTGGSGTPSDPAPVRETPDAFAPQERNDVNVTIKGAMFTPEVVRDLIEAVNEEIGDGANIKVNVI